jgi:single-strand DNA-binding protein
MAYLNKVLLIGNLGKDPEIKVIPSGKKNATFSLATSEKVKDNTGEYRERTEWHNISAWGVNAENIEKLGIQKGTSLYLEGRINYQSWEDSTGQKKYKTVIELDKFQILSPKTERKPQNNETQGDAAFPDDNLPF